MKYLRRIFVLLALLVWTGTAASQGAKDTDFLRNGPKIMQAFRTVVAKPSTATVRVVADGKEVAFGAIVDADGWILTKWSEVRDRAKIQCKFSDGKKLDAKIIGVKDDEEAAYDLAMLKVDAKDLPTVEWGSSKEATVGRWVASPGIGADPVGVGVVSVAVRQYKERDQPPKLDNAYAGYLGVNLAEGTGGAKVTDVAKGSPAARAEIQINDIIYEAAGRRILDAESLINTIGRLKPGDDVLLKLKRDEEELEVRATLGKRPKNLLGNPQERIGAKLSTRRGGFPAIIQHDTGLNPEDCGGPLVDLDGKTIGINIARAGRTETYAIPSENVRTLLADLKSGKLAPKVLTGELQPVPPKDPDQLLNTITSLTSKDPLSKTRKGRFTKVYELKLTAGVTYAIELDGAEFDAFLVLEDATGKVLAEDDDAGGYPNAKIVFTPKESGLYRVIATSFDPGETGTFHLKVRKHAGQAKEKAKK